MAIMIQANKEGSEMEFCKYYEQHLLNKTTATFDKIKEAGAILGKSFDISCPSCAKNSWQELLSIYNSLLQRWETYKIEQTKPIEPIFTKFEDEEIKSQEIKTKSKK